MLWNTELIIPLLLSLGVAFVTAFATTPVVKIFAQKIAMDEPGEERRVHDHPIPRMGGLAIFLGFVISVILFADITKQVQGILIGCVIIVATGAVDDIRSLSAVLKLFLQLAAAIIAVAHGVVIEVVMNPNVFSETQHLVLGILSIPVTVIWIVGITNSVNFIDGLDGLACGVSVISSITMLVTALLVSESGVAVILAALTGACLGFIPYNFNPAKIFMGDTGALLLGYVLATMSVVGLFKFYAIVTFAVPLLALAVPLMDTTFAFFRRILRGQNPMHPDRGHFHHRLIDMGLSQKQAVAVLYSVSAILGLIAVVLTTRSQIKFLLLIIAFLIAATVGVFLVRTLRRIEHEKRPEEETNEKS